MKKLMLSCCVVVSLIITNVSPLFSEEVGKAVLYKDAPSSTSTETPIGIVKKLGWSTLGGIYCYTLNVAIAGGYIGGSVANEIYKIPIEIPTEIYTDILLKLVFKTMEINLKHVRNLAVNSFMSGFLGTMTYLSVSEDKRIYPILATAICMILSNVLAIKNLNLPKLKNYDTQQAIESPPASQANVTFLD